MDSQCFPADILSEIFSRTSLETVGKFRVLSRACNSASYDWNFLKKLAERTNTISGFFIQSFAFGRYSSYFISPNGPRAVDAVDLEFLPANEIQIVAASKQGLLLCENNAPRRHRIPEFYVCKPTTRQWQHIPNPRTRFFTVAMGMVVLGSNPLRYRIVRLSQTKEIVKKFRSEIYCTLHCEVFDSATWKWKKSEDDVRLPYGHGFIGWNVPPVSACGVLYWILSNRQVLALHPCGDGEYWRIFDVPFLTCSKEQYYDVKLAEYCGRLGAICRGNGFFELWIMEDGEGDVWTKRHSVKGMDPPTAFLTSDIILTRGYWDVRCCNFKNGNELLKLRCTMDRDGGVFHFQSDFEAIREYISS